MKTLVVFVGGALLFGAVVLSAGYCFWETDALVQGATAFALAFIPALLTLAWAVFSYGSAPEMQLMASLGGTGVRMAIALGGGYLLTSALPQLFDMTFWYWLLVFYLGLLGFEIALLARQQPTMSGPPPA